MAKLYRETALEKLSSPDRLDRMLKVSPPLSWVAVPAAALICAAVVLWSFLGYIPKIESGVGVLCDPYGVNTVYSEYGGTVSEILVKEGSAVSVGTEVVRIKDKNGTDRTVCSDQNGIVSEILVAEGMNVGTLGEIVRISPNVESGLAAVCYVPLSVSKQLSPGMSANVYMSSADPVSKSCIKAKIINVDAYAASQESLSGMIGAGLTSQAAQSPAVCVTCELERDSESESGFKFVGNHGSEPYVTFGEPVSVQFEISRRAPITIVFPVLEGLYE